MPKPTVKLAIEAVNKRGILLVFPIKGKNEPESLWSYFYPKQTMRWEWDKSGDQRVVDLWHLRESVASSKKVVYAKWYQGRATFFSFELFTLFLGRLSLAQNLEWAISQEAKTILELLEIESPQSTKALKKQLRSEFGWKGSDFDKAFKELSQLCLVVGTGEIPDGAFPSLAVGATQVLFESLFKKAQTLSPRVIEEKWKTLPKNLAPFMRHLGKIETKIKPVSRPNRKKRLTFDELQKVSVTKWRN